MEIKWNLFSCLLIFGKQRVYPNVFDLLFRIWHMKWYSIVIQNVFTYNSTSSMLSSKNIMFWHYSMLYLYTHDVSYALWKLHICSLSCYIAYNYLRYTNVYWVMWMLWAPHLYNHHNCYDDELIVWFLTFHMSLLHTQLKQLSFNIPQNFNKLISVWNNGEQASKSVPSVLSCFVNCNSGYFSYFFNIVRN